MTKGPLGRLMQHDGLGQRCRRPSVGSTWSGEAAAGGRRRAKDDRRRSPCTRVEDSASRPRSTCVREPHDCRPSLRGCSHLLQSTRHKDEAPGEGARPQRRRKAPRELGADQQLPVGPTAEAHTPTSLVSSNQAPPSARSQCLRARCEMQLRGGGIREGTHPRATMEKVTATSPASMARADAHQVEVDQQGRQDQATRGGRRPPGGFSRERPPWYKTHSGDENKCKGKGQESDGQPLWTTSRQSNTWPPRLPLLFGACLQASMAHPPGVLNT